MSTADPHPFSPPFSPFRKRKKARRGTAGQEAGGISRKHSQVLLELPGLLLPLSEHLTLSKMPNPDLQRRWDLVFRPLPDPGCQPGGSREKYIADVASSTAQEFILAGKHKEAIPAAFHALRFGSAVFGPRSAQLVPAYLLLAEASVGAGDLLQAGRYLSQAQWIVLGAPGCGGAVRSRLQRGLGQLRIAEGNLQQALHHLASDVYLASSTFGLKSLEAAMGYFHMANVFFRQNKMDIANSLYAKVTSLWCDRLLSAVQAHERVLRSRSDMSPFAEDEDVAEQPLTEAQRAEGTRVLSAVLEIRSQAPKPELGEMARVLHGLAMLRYLGSDLPAAGEMGLRAFELVKRLPQQEALEPIARLLRLINSAPSPAK